MIIYLIYTIILVRKKITGNDYEIRETINKEKKFILNNNNKEIHSDKYLSLNKIVGLESVKDELRYYLDFIKNREKYKKWNVKLPKGILLIGPPGTGKTLLVKTLAKEIELPVIHTSGSEFVEMYVGVGASRVRKLFARARTHKNGCIVFIDEIDAIGKKRAEIGGNSERDNTLNQLLVEIDGFGTDDNIIVFGATNLVKNLDKALTRSGRFDKKVYFDAPNREERKKLFELYLNDIKINDNISYDKLAELTSGLNGADIANICNQSKINLIQEHIKLEENKKQKLNEDKKQDKSEHKKEDISEDKKEDKSDDKKEDTSDDKKEEIINDEKREESNKDIKEEELRLSMNNIHKAIDEVMIGREKPERKMELFERERVAHHEAGHAFMGYVLKHSNPPIKVSILPRGENALGFSQPKPDDKKLYTQDILLSQISVLLGGRVVEKIIYGNYSSGAHDDIEKVTIIAKHWFLNWGMSSCGPLNYSELNNTISDEMVIKIKNFIKKIEKETFNILNKNKEYIIKIAKLLLEKETIIYSDINELLPKEFENMIETINYE
jgi:ATP-dependent Zn protease